MAIQHQTITRTTVIVSIIPLRAHFDEMWIKLLRFFIQEKAFKNVVYKSIHSVKVALCYKTNYHYVTTNIMLLLTLCYKTNFRKTSNISRTVVGNKIVDNSDVVEASPVGAAPTTSSFST